MRPLNRYITPPQGTMEYLHKKRKKNIYLFFLSAFLWVHSILQPDITIYVLVIRVIAFAMMSVNSLLLASILCISTIGIHMSADLVSFVSIGVFSGALLVGSVWMIGGSGESKGDTSGNLDASNVMGYYGGDSCDGGGDC